ncbi:MAG: ABC transporter permease [Bacteroidota bacterium]
MNKTPSNFWLRFFRWYCHPEYVEDLEGDLVERFENRAAKKGIRKAKWGLTLDVIKLFRPEIIKPLEGYKTLNHYGMIKNYLTIGWRNLLRNKVYAVINIGGLAIGMTAAILIGLWVLNEFSYNRSFKNNDRIGRLYHNLDFGDDIITYEDMPYALGEELKNNQPDFDYVVMTLGAEEHELQTEDKKLSEITFFVDQEFPNLLPLPMLEGTRAGLTEINSIMLSESVAKALFNNDALGKTVKFDNSGLLTVTGIFQDFPITSHFSQIKALAPLEYHFNMNEGNRAQRNDWEDLSYGCLVLLNDQSTWAKAEERIKNLFLEKSPESIKPFHPEALLHPMTKWNLYEDFEGGKNVEGKIKLIKMLGAVGLIVLALACVNFINLSTAQSSKRSKEVGIRKVMGSGRNQLISQFIAESLLISMIAYATAILFTFLLLPGFNALNDTQIELPWSNGSFIATSFILVLFTGVLAGSYPAFYLSSFKPVRVLKSKTKTGLFTAIPRKLLIVFQFTVSSVMIVGTAVIFLQIQHTKNRPRGFDLEGIVQIPIKSDELVNTDYNTLRADLLATGFVENMAKSDHPVTGSMSSDASLSWVGKDPESQPIVAMNYGSHDFPSTNGFEFLEGRDFSRDYLTDSSAVIINEMAAKLFAPTKSAVGTILTLGEGENQIEKEVIGVIRDQVRWAPFEKQSPHIYTMSYEHSAWLTIRMQPRVDVQNALISIEEVLKKYDPDSPFEFTFQDEDYRSEFSAEERIGKLATIFSGLAIIISCVGIFGLASFASSQRSKEISIRKILGASALGIWKMLSSDFVKLVLISSVIASPVAYIVANGWLEKYYYRIDFSWSIPIIAFFVLLGITLITISLRSIKAAKSNPIDAIRNE